jgi:hypothetical protein
LKFFLIDTYYDIKLYPYIIRILLFYIYEIRQYQIVQTARNELILIYVLQNQAIDIEQELIRTINRAHAQWRLENHVKIRLKQADSSSQNKPSGKYKKVISLGRPSDLN